MRNCRYQRTAQRMTSAGKRKPRNARALGMNGDLEGGCCGGAPLLPAYGASLNTTEPVFRSLLLTELNQRPAQGKAAQGFRQHEGGSPALLAGISSDAAP